MSYAKALRRELHEYPEVGFELPRTLALVRRELERMGVEYTEKYGKSSIVATVNPEKSGYTIAIRADMDALPIQETSDVPYKSKNDGMMHACGHDAHTAIALAALDRINSMRESIDCRVKFLFQPAEEYRISGARLMAEDGVMDDIDAIVALHCDPTCDVGKIKIIDGDRNAISDGFMLHFYGKSAHAAHREDGVDAILMAARAYSELVREVTPENSGECTVFNVGKIRGGETNNIVCDACSMFATLRSFSDEGAARSFAKIREICERVAKEIGGRFELETVKHYPKVYNDPEVAAAVRRCAVGLLGAENVGEETRGLGGEDFSYFADIKPGAMFRLGTRTPGCECVYGLHHDKFDIDESALEIGVELFVRFVLENMNGYKK
ncbi:MAG: amidohydrolase [Clostridia bacterium]|nr:amidohydrolase [Clostridia bacterium]